MNCDFFHVRWKQFSEDEWRKMTTYDYGIQHGSRHWRVRTSSCKISSSWVQTCRGSWVILLTIFCPISQWQRIQKSGPVILTPMTLKSCRVHAVVKLLVHARAKFHQAKCSGSWVIVRTDNSDENNTVYRYRAYSITIRIAFRSGSIFACSCFQYTLRSP